MGLPAGNCVVLVQGLGLGGGTLAPGVLFFCSSFLFLPLSTASALVDTLVFLGWDVSTGYLVLLGRELWTVTCDSTLLPFIPSSSENSRFWFSLTMKF